MSCTCAQMTSVAVQACTNFELELAHFPVTAVGHPVSFLLGLSLVPSSEQELCLSVFQKVTSNG